MTITFFKGNEYTETEYTGETSHVIAAIDMIDHINRGGWCMMEVGNRATMITSVSQII